MLRRFSHPLSARSWSGSCCQDEDPFVIEHAKEALNFQISTTIAGLLVSLSMAVLIGCLLLPVFLIAALVLPILAIVAASQGQSYRYPYNWRLVE